MKIHGISDKRASSIEDPAKSIKKFYEQNIFTKKCFRRRCGGKGAKLTGATSSNYIILDGDEIKKCLKKEEQSADCVLIKHVYENEEVIYFIELTSGSHHWKKILSKLQNTYQRIHYAFENMDLSHPRADFLYIGRLVSAREYSILKSKEIITENGKRPINSVAEECDIKDLIRE